MKIKNLCKMAVLTMIAAVVAGCGGDDTPTATAAVGAGANLQCASSGKNAYATYGSAAFVAVNQQIFANVNSEITANGTTNLGTSFTEVGSGNPASTSDSLAVFEGNLAAFLVFTYGGPSSIVYTDGQTYQGPQDMTESHQGLAITNAQFTYFVDNIVVPALTTKGVSSADVSDCFAPAITSASFIASVVGH